MYPRRVGGDTFYVVRWCVDGWREAGVVGGWMTLAWKIFRKELLE